MASRIIEGARLRDFNKPGSMGLVNDVFYKNCHWPGLDEPTALFEKGSSGIEVEGPPTPRNVVFPDDTLFVGNTKRACFFVRTVENKLSDVEKEKTGSAEINGKLLNVSYKEVVKEFVDVHVVADVTEEEAKELVKVK